MVKRAVKTRESEPTHSKGVESAAPALSRGIALLKLLNEASSLSLEQIAGQTGWPKSSVARLLGVLEKEGLLLRDPSTRHYTAVYDLRRKESTESLLRQLAPQSLQTLAEETKQTAELYLVEDANSQVAEPVLIDQCEPADAVVHVLARVGNRRDLVELDATVQIIQAFSKVKLPARGRWVWYQGKQRKLPASEQKKLISQALGKRLGLDASINTHGVYRYAVPLFDPHGKLRAVLVLAQLCTAHSPVPPQDKLINALQKEGAQLQARLNQTL